MSNKNTRTLWYTVLAIIIVAIIYTLATLATLAVANATTSQPEWRLMAASGESSSLAYWAVPTQNRVTVTLWQSEDQHGQRSARYMVWYDCENGAIGLAEHTHVGVLLGGINCQGQPLQQPFLESLPAPPKNLTEWLFATNKV